MSISKTMGAILGKAWRILSVIALPLLKDKETKKELEEFAQMVIHQMQSLVESMQKIIDDYLELSRKIKEMHSEICTLQEKLTAANVLSCKDAQVCSKAVR